MTPDLCHLLPSHLADLRRSGLTDETICAAHLASVSDAESISQILNWSRPATCLGSCLLIPFHDRDGRRNGYARLKPDRPRTAKGDGKLVKYESPCGKPNRAYFPVAALAAVRTAGARLLLSEGEKKSLAATQAGFPCIGLTGVWSWQQKRKNKDGPRKLIKDLDGENWQGRQAVIAFDSDLADKPEVQWAEYYLADTLKAKGALVKAIHLPPGPNGAKQGLDDFLVANGAAALEELLATAQSVTKPEDARPQIIITTEEHEVNAEAASALAEDGDIYQRGGLLVRVVRDASPAAKGIRRPFAPRIEPLPPPLLRERLAATARWVIVKERKDGATEQPARPPAWCVAAVYARADWPDIRHLEAVVDYPVLRPDGTILATPGYDPETGLLLDSAARFPSIPANPSRQDAMAGCQALLEVVQDFPFEQEVHKAAYLAALLSPLARFAFTGPSPLFLVDANVRAAGKGLLLDTIAHIVTGERFTIATYTQDEDELRKRITSLVLAGDRLVLLDNLDGKFGNAVLDAALTGTAWKDRILGVNRMAEAPLYMTWYATGNNVLIAADTARRVCHIRLESAQERPEERQDFTHPNLLAWVGEQRLRLLGAALTVLRGYCAAGRPDQHLKAWGSFEGWSALVRSAVVWVGLPDPGKTRLMLQAQADVAAENMAVILNCLEQLDREQKGLTAAEIIQKVKPTKDAPAPYPDLCDALEALLGKLEPRLLGNRLRLYRRRVFQGRYIDQVRMEKRAARWAVFPAEEFWSRPKRTHQTHQTHPTGGESGESVSPQAETPQKPETAKNTENLQTSEPDEFKNTNGQTNQSNPETGGYGGFGGYAAPAKPSPPPDDTEESFSAGRRSIATKPTKPTTPPAGAKLHYQDEHGRPCGAGTASWWTWEGADRWYAYDPDANGTDIPETLDRPS
jgi:hypothetical protein